MAFIATTNLNFNPANYPLVVCPWRPGVSIANPILAAALWWSTYNGGDMADDVTQQDSPNIIAPPEFVSAGPDSHLRFKFATPSEMIEVSGAFRSHALMTAHTDAIAGVHVNCFDPDPALRGRYQKTTPAGQAGWTRVSSTIFDKLWTDRNHPQRMLELLICSWAHANVSAGFQGGPAMFGRQNGDWRNLRLTWDLRAKDLMIGPWAKIMMHVQGEIPRLGRALSQSYPDAPVPKYVIPNMANKTQLISDQLGFGVKSWGQPNGVPIVRDSGRRNVVVDLTTNDSAWEQFGDTGRTPNGRIVNYSTAPIEEVLWPASVVPADVTGFRGNAYMLTHHVTPQEDWWVGNAAAAAIRDFDRTQGVIEFYGLKIEEEVV